MDSSVGEPSENPGLGLNPDPSATPTFLDGHPGGDPLRHQPSSAGTPPEVEGNISASKRGRSGRRSQTSGVSGVVTPADQAHQRYLFLAVTVIAVCVGVVMWAVAIREVLFNTNTATGGDMGAHVWTADFVARKLVGQGRITGWSDDWFAGFPVLGFYFPFPFWIMTILDLVGIPYNVAFKFVTITGLIGMPLTGYGMGHFAGLRKPLPVFCGLATLPFLFDQQFAIYGGNIKSTMAGEFSFALSLCLGLLFLGLLSHIMRTGEKRATAAAVLAMTGLSHLLPTIWVGVAGTFLILTHLDARRTNIRNAYTLFTVCGAVTGAAWVIGHERAGIVVAAFIALAAIAYDSKTAALGLGQFAQAFMAVAAGAALAAFWIWPFWNHLPYTNDMGYEKEQRYLWGLFPWVSDKPEAGSAVFFFAFCLAVIGALYSFATLARAVRRSVTPATSWLGWGSAFCFAASLLVTAAMWNQVLVAPRGNNFWADAWAVDKNSWFGARWVHAVLIDMTTYTNLCRLLVFVFALVVLHVLVMAWAIDDRWQRFGVALSLVTALCGFTFRFSPYGFRLWNNRVLPFWLMGIYVMAGFGVYAIGKAVSRVLRLGQQNTVLGRNRHIAGIAAGVLVTHAAIALPLGLVPRFFPAPQFSKNKTTLTKADGTTEAKKSGGWLVGVRTAGASGDFDSSAAKGWPPYNYQGYESRGANWKDYQRIIKKMQQIGKEHGCGRTHWEYESKQDRWGTPMALMLLPYWTDSCIQSMEGLYFESAASAPYHWMDAGLLSKAPSNPQRDLPYKGLDIAAGVESLADFGIRYYMAFSTVALEQADKNPNLTLIGTEKYERSCDDAETKAGTCPTTWKIYEVKGAQLVEPLASQPVVVTGIGQSQQEGWLDLGVAAFNSPERFTVPFVAGVPRTPPSTWQRVKVSSARDRVNKEFGATVTFDQPKVVPLEKVTVGNIRAASLGNSPDSKPGTLSFSVDKINIPVVVKMSYFPNFRAKGAKGPYRLSDNRMVVIPTSKNVTIQYKWDKNDYLGFLAGLCGIGMCVAMFLTDRRRRQVAETAHIAQWRAGLRAPAGDATPQRSSELASDTTTSDTATSDTATSDTTTSDTATSDTATSEHRS